MLKYVTNMFHCGLVNPSRLATKDITASTDICGYINFKSTSSTSFDLIKQFHLCVLCARGGIHCPFHAQGDVGGIL